jgi:hypothetical protein
MLCSLGSLTAIDLFSPYAAQAKEFPNQWAISMVWPKQAVGNLGIHLGRQQESQEQEPKSYFIEPEC